MTQATAAITDKFKNTYVYTYGLPESVVEAVQEAYFRMGFSYHGKRTAWKGPHSYIRVDENGCMFRASGTHQNRPEAYGEDKSKEVSYTYLRDSAEAVRRIKREEHKASKKRKAKRKWDATARKNCFVGCPVRKDETVSVKLANGRIYTDRAWTWFWGQCGDSTIVSYKVHKRNTHRPQPAKKVTQEEMFFDLAKDMGKSVALQVDSLSAIGGPVGTLTTGDAILDPNGKVLTTGDFVKAVESPDTNPKRQYGVSSVPLNMWSPLASAYGALGLYNGSLKYGKANFANTPVEASIYIAAAMRHLNAWACGQEDDPADGVPNLGGVLANIAILLEARAAGTLIDDRLRMAGYLKELDMLKAKVKALNELHAGKNPKHYTLDQA